MLSEFESKNHLYLRKLLEEEKVALRQFPEEVLAAFKRYTQEVIGEITEKDPVSKKVYSSFSSFQRNILQWSRVSEEAFYSRMK